MFEAMVNKQFKARYSGLNGVVNIGAISVLRRIFKVHKIEGYVLQNNIENETVIMNKGEFEKLCDYIKVEIERTSKIPRARVYTEKGRKLVELNPGSLDGNIMTYKVVGANGYISYLNKMYASLIQDYKFMVRKGMNFSHYEVIYKAMNSDMREPILSVYNKGVEKVNRVLRLREYNAEEYQVALLSLAYIGVGQLNPEFLEIICRNDGSGAKAMEHKLEKYMEKTAKGDTTEEIDEEEDIWSNWYVDYMENKKDEYMGYFTKEENGTSIYLTIALVNGSMKIKISRESLNKGYKLIIQTKEKSKSISYNKDSNILELQQRLENILSELIKGEVKVEEKEIKEDSKDIYNGEHWLKNFIDRHPDIFEETRSVLSEESSENIEESYRVKFKDNTNESEVLVLKSCRTSGRLNTEVYIKDENFKNGGYHNSFNRKKFVVNSCINPEDLVKFDTKMIREINFNIRVYKNLKDTKENRVVEIFENLLHRYKWYINPYVVNESVIDTKKYKTWAYEYKTPKNLIENEIYLDFKLEYSNNGEHDTFYVYLEDKTNFLNLNDLSKMSKEIKLDKVEYFSEAFCDGIIRKTMNELIVSYNEMLKKELEKTNSKVTKSEFIEFLEKWKNLLREFSDKYFEKFVKSDDIYYGNDVCDSINSDEDCMLRRLNDGEWFDNSEGNNVVVRVALRTGMYSPELDEDIGLFVANYAIDIYLFYVLDSISENHITYTITEETDVSEVFLEAVNNLEGCEFITFEEYMNNYDGQFFSAEEYEDYTLRRIELFDGYIEDVKAGSPKINMNVDLDAVDEELRKYLLNFYGISKVKDKLDELFYTYSNDSYNGNAFEGLDTLFDFG